MKYKQQAFTLVELIMVILLLGILSVSVVPKMFTQSDVEYITVRDLVVAQLRLAQIKAMNQTTICTRVKFSSSHVGIEQNVGASCGSAPDESVGVNLGDVSVTMVGAALPFYITFDGQGRGVLAQTGQCSPCQIEISGSGIENIVIESQGYIHAL